MRLRSVLVAQGSRLRVVLVNTLILSVLVLSISSQWWTNGFPGSSVSPAEYRGPYIYHHDQTLALLYFQDGQHISECKLMLSEAGDPTDKIQLLNHFSEKMPVVEVKFPEMMATIDVCNNLPAPAPPQTAAQSASQTGGEGRFNIMALTRGILPGTLWCGVNDIAPDFSSLGVDRELDRCCRAHDHCPVKVKPFRTKYGVLNLDLYTKSHCYCDEKFYNCLKNQENKKAKAVGDFFFNVISVKCIEERVRRHCVQRSLNSSQPSRLVPEAKHFLNLGISFGVKNQTNCLKWEDEPGVKFFEFKVKKPF